MLITVDEPAAEVQWHVCMREERAQLQLIERRCLSALANHVALTLWDGVLRSSAAPQRVLGHER